MSIACRLIEVATEALANDGSRLPVTLLRLRIGTLTAVVPDSLTFCFGIAAKGTRLAGARLEIEEVPVVLVCRKCRGRSQIDGPPFLCRACGAPETDMVSGRELMVESIELDDEMR